MTSALDHTAAQVDQSSSVSDFDSHLHVTWPRHVVTQPGYDSADQQPEVGGKNWKENMNNTAYAGGQADTWHHDQPVEDAQSPLFPSPPPPPVPAPVLTPVPSMNLRLAGDGAKIFPVKVFSVRRLTHAQWC